MSVSGLTWIPQEPVQRFRCGEKERKRLSKGKRALAANPALARHPGHLTRSQDGNIFPGMNSKAHPKTKASLTRWHTLVKAARWASMDDVRQAAPNATVLNAQRVRFEIAGGNYRLIVMIHFRRRMVFVNFIGTHAEYDKVDALTVSQF
jgi:mRNA interferase HigB